MVSSKLLSAAALVSLAYAAQNQNNNANNANANGADSTTLLPNAIASGSFFDGSDGEGAEAGQALSQTSKNNFINLCAGQTLTNGLQILDGSCNPIPMGFIPAKTKMISSIILFPQEGQQIQSGQDFNISVQTTNLQAGAFTNADATYYAAPQALNGAGQVIGHTHVTVQDLGNSLNPKTPPDPTQFAFFKGINDAGNGQGLLQATVAGGLPAGNFRLCTLTSSANHQPVLMPVAQRGSQDDCTKFTVVGNDNTANAASNDGSGGEAAAAAAASAVALGPGAITGSGNAAQASATATAAATANNGNSNANANANQNANSGKGNANGNANKGNANAGQGANANKGNANANKGQQGKAKRLARVAQREFVA